jgi:arabinogalactan endo-1,4-beta-galactosidase
MTRSIFIILLILSLPTISCRKDKGGGDGDTTKKVRYSPDRFVMGADLSYVNQILDHGGVYRDSDEIRDPYRIFDDNGANLVRLRLWHHPVWTMDVYGTGATQMYNDLPDVALAIERSKQQGMAVLLDLHYSDTWADPGKQIPPAAWKDIKDLTVLKDSVYQYTYKVLDYLKGRNLFPEMIQVGNEINCGLLQTNTEEGFPALNCCDGHWTELGEVINSGIRAIREISSDLTQKPLIVLHVADPANVEWWFDNIKLNGKVTDFDVVGISYYPLWHTTISYNSIPALISAIKTRYNKKVMILETAYPWTREGADDYTNSFGNQDELVSFPFTKDGQREFMIDMTRSMISAGLNGIIYWEPAWITSQMKDLWSTGSSWENAALFDFEGNVLPSFQYMMFPYQFPD